MSRRRYTRPLTRPFPVAHRQSLLLAGSTDDYTLEVVDGEQADELLPVL